MILFDYFLIDSTSPGQNIHGHMEYSHFFIPLGL